MWEQEQNIAYISRAERRSRKGRLACRPIAPAAAAWHGSGMIKPARPLTLLACALLLPAAGPRPLRQPIKPWVLDYGATACTALRTYGSGKAPVTLALRPSPNGNVVRLVVMRPGRAPKPYHFPVTTNLSDARVKTTGLRFQPKGARHDLVWINFERSALDGLAGAGEIAIRGGSDIDERFALPGIAAVLKGLDTCNADLRRYWNVGDAGAPLSAPATPLKPLPHYFSSDDYPFQAFHEGASGASKIMMMVDESGALKDCMVEETSGIATLDAMACLVLLERARFRPALDAAGKPARSVLTTRVVWRMP
jgi:TonB-like protein